MACGEYGDNIKTLVNAIKNGKHDIRAGYPFPDLKGENLNNSIVATEGDNGWKYGLTKNVEGMEIKENGNKDKNDASTIEDKFPENKVNNEVNNGGIIPSSATNDIAKQSTFSTLGYSIVAINGLILSMSSRRASINSHLHLLFLI